MLKCKGLNSKIFYHSNTLLLPLLYKNRFKKRSIKVTFTNKSFTMSGHVLSNLIVRSTLHRCKPHTLQRQNPVITISTCNNRFPIPSNLHLNLCYTLDNI